MKLQIFFLFFFLAQICLADFLEDEDLLEYSGLKFSPVDGVVVKRNKGASIIDKSFYSKGRKNGVSELFHANGELRAKGNFSDDIQGGLWLWYRKDGSLERRGYYLKGEWDGLWEWFDATEKPTMQKVYRNGKLLKEAD